MDSLKIPVSFGNVGVGEQTARIGVQFERTEKLTLDEVNRIFCGKRMQGKITAHANGDDPGQKYLPGTEDLKHEIEGSFDVKSFRVTPKNITAGLSFSIASINANELPGFAKKTGTLTVSAVAGLEDTTDEGEEIEEEEEDRPLMKDPPTRIRLLRSILGQSTLREDTEHDVVSTGPNGTLVVQGKDGKPIELKQEDYVAVS